MENEERFELDNLRVARIGKGDEKTVKSTELIICRALDNEENFKDILTNTIYPLNRFTSNQIGKMVAFFPYPLTSEIEDTNLKSKILDQGYITKREAIKIYNILNENETKENDLEFCNILNEKIYLEEPAIFREQELEELIISLALNKKIALLTGPSGIGKTAIIDELAYLSQKKQLPEFLQDKKIVELKMAYLTKPKKEIKPILEYIKNNKAILVIDGISEINSNNESFIDIIISEAERENIKVIITTTNTKYNNISIDNAISNKFDLIEVKELEEEEIRTIAQSHFEYLRYSKDISLLEIENNLEEILNILITITTPDDNNNNKVNINSYSNPGFILSLIDNSFAIAQAKKESTLTLDHILKAIQRDKRINSNQLENAKKVFETFETTSEKPKRFFKGFNN